MLDIQQDELHAKFTLPKNRKMNLPGAFHIKNHKNMIITNQPIVTNKYKTIASDETVKSDVLKKAYNNDFYLTINDLEGSFKATEAEYIHVSDNSVVPIESFEETYLGSSHLLKVNIHLPYVPNLNNTAKMFMNCDNVTWIDIRDTDLSNVQSMSQMFAHCPNLRYINMSNCNPPGSCDMYKIFSHDTNLLWVNVSGWSAHAITKLLSSIWMTKEHLPILQDCLEVQLKYQEKIEEFEKHKPLSISPINSLTLCD